MNNRLDHTADNQLITRLQAIKTSLDTLRTAQRVSGSSGTLNYPTTTGNTWDWNETVGTDGDGLTHQVIFTIQFTGDGTQQFPTEMCLFDLFINSATIATGPIESNRLTPQASTWTDGTRSVSLLVNPVISNPVEQYAASVPTKYTDPLVWQWKLGITFFSARITYFMKASSLGTSPGALTVTRVVT